MESLEDIAGDMADNADDSTDKQTIPKLPQILNLGESLDLDGGAKTTLDRGVLHMKMTMSDQRAQAQ